MCLDEVDNNMHVPTAKGVGWKVFRLEDGRLYPELRGKGFYVVNAWYEAYDIGLSGDPLRYRLGFHVFPHQDDAESWNNQPDCVVRKVRWRHLLATGSQRWRGSDREIVVAKEILILPAKGVRKSPAR